jgi:hypothetical protein
MEPIGAIHCYMTKFVTVTESAAQDTEHAKVIKHPFAFCFNADLND